MFWISNVGKRKAAVSDDNNMKGNYLNIFDVWKPSPFIEKNESWFSERFEEWGILGSALQTASLPLGVLYLINPQNLEAGPTCCIQEHGSGHALTLYKTYDPFAQIHRLFFSSLFKNKHRDCEITLKNFRAIVRENFFPLFHPLL